MYCEASSLGEHPDGLHVFDIMCSFGESFFIACEVMVDS